MDRIKCEIEYSNFHYPPKAMFAVIILSSNIFLAFQLLAGATRNKHIFKDRGGKPQETHLS